MVASSAAVELGIVDEPLAERLDLLERPSAEQSALVGERADQRATQRVPQAYGRHADARLRQHPLLEVLEARTRLRVVLQLLGEVGQPPVEGDPGVVVRRTADLGNPLDDLLVHPAGHPLVEPLRRPGRCTVLDEGGDLFVVDREPAAQLVQGKVDEAPVRVVAKDLLEELAHDGTELLLLEPRDQRLLDHGRDIGLLDVAERIGQHARALGDEALAVPVGDEPLPYAPADSLLTGCARGRRPPAGSCR